MRAMVIATGERADGRTPEEIRPLYIKPGYLPRVHGSGLFQRGQTQVLSVVTLGMLNEWQRLDTIDPAEGKRYMHQYNFPPYCTGEAGRMGAPKRREIGHGALAERALMPVLPDEDEFPYAIRVVSEVLESNGSSSMASTCGSTLALMDAGVPIKAPVSGIAMGLIKAVSYTHLDVYKRQSTWSATARRASSSGRRAPPSSRSAPRPAPTWSNCWACGCIWISL